MFPMETESVSLRAAAMTLRTVLLSLQALLAAAEPDDPQDAVVANQVGKTFLCAFDAIVQLFSSFLILKLPKHNLFFLIELY